MKKNKKNKKNKEHNYSAAIIITMLANRMTRLKESDYLELMIITLWLIHLVSRENKKIVKANKKKARVKAKMAKA